MNVRNDHLRQTLFVTPHAHARWAERGGGDLRDSLRRALPFGGQIGDDALLLEFNGLVFSVKFDDQGGTVTTVLTRQQATANLQANCKVTRNRTKSRRWRGLAREAKRRARLEE